jgi:hypothetical protein
MMRWIGTFIIILYLAGCGGRVQQHPWGTLKECEDSNTELSMQVQTLQSQNDQLTEQVATLSGLDSKTRLAAISTLEKIRIGKRTGFYDKDDDGAKETLIVYLEPLDNQQDTIKAIGECRVDLWNLNQPSEQANIFNVRYNSDDLNQNWGGNIFGSYFRLTVDPNTLPDGLPGEESKEITIKATFTDYLSGKVLTDQKIVIAEK